MRGGGQLRLGPLVTVMSAVFAVLVGTSNAAAQSLTSGSLRGVVQTATGEPLDGVQVTLENRAGGTVKLLETDRNGAFKIPLMSPGEYRLLVEQVGFQPVRRKGIQVTAGQTTNVLFVLERHPPPITSVVEIEGAVLASGAAPGRQFIGRELEILDRRRDLSDLSRGSSEVLQPGDGRNGFASSTLGLPANQVRLFVDGIEETLLRHPGFQSEPISSPIFGRDGLEQAQIISTGIDAEYRGVLGSMVMAQTRRGSNLLTFAPFVRYSGAKLGGATTDNPTDSVGSSLQFGAVLSGAIVPDTAHFMIRADYQSLEVPTAFPWQVDTAVYGGHPVAFRPALQQVAHDSFGTNIAGAISPVLRRWKGGSGLANLDWQVSKNNLLIARIGFASWKEEQPQLGLGLESGSGTNLDARDVSSGLSLTTAGDGASNELRIGFSSSHREWGSLTTAAPIPSTALAAEGVAFGFSGGFPATFDRQLIDFSDAFQVAFGSHLLKAGLNVGADSYDQDYRYGTSGVFSFGDLDHFRVPQGDFFQTAGAPGSAKFTATNLGVFIQDAWSLLPEIQVYLGLRYDHQALPTGKLSRNVAWLNASGIFNDHLPNEKKGLSPRFGFVWNVENRSEWFVHGGVGSYQGALDPASFAEAMLYSGTTTIHRAQGTITGWPNAPTGTALTDLGPRLTMFTLGYRAPRSTKAEFGVTRSLGNSLTLRANAAYAHADYLLNRLDLNREISTVGTTQEGRPVYGTLVQQGGLVSSLPGSNRRFTTFDMVSALVPTGFSDYYEVTLGLERRVTQSLSLMASYTYSKTTDNTVGSLSPNPADQLSPFPDGLNGADWTRGRSDFDIPHRVAVTAEYRTTGRNPVTFSGRYRWRSGLPFTPGFRSGVDVNGDGSGNNDPAFLSSAVSGLSALVGSCESGVTNTFAVRNSCRDPSVQSLDLGFAVGLPVGRGPGTVSLTVDAFNVVGTATGLIDHALVLINPNGGLSVDPAGNVTLPLVANARFGNLLSRRGEPRMVRIGLRMDY